MDNVTHSLFGYALARALPQSIAGSPPKRRALMWCSVLASNAPDADFLVGAFAHDAKLAYLVHHRGHTHTLALALPLGLLLGAVCARLARVDVARDRLHVMLLGAAACVLHVLFDALNNYGVHPFFPLDNHWYYGDAVFIVEPLLLSVMLPLLAQRAETRIGRALGWLLSLLLLILLAWTSQLLPIGLLVALGLVLGLCQLIGRLVRIDGRGTLCAVAAVVATFCLGSLAAKARLRSELARVAPAEQLLDLASQPLPGNPLCWNTLAVSRDRAGTYRARYVYQSLAPGWFSARQCRIMPRGATTARLQAPGLRDAPGLAYGGTFEAALAELRALSARSCQAAALLRFARVPYWTSGREPTLIGDLRYDSAPELEFAEIEAGSECRDWLPPWLPPRADLLR